MLGATQRLMDAERGAAARAQEAAEKARRQAEGEMARLRSQVGL